MFLACALLSCGAVRWAFSLYHVIRKSSVAPPFPTGHSGLFTYQVSALPSPSSSDFNPLALELDIYILAHPFM